MLRMSATETKLLTRVGGARCPAYGFFRYFALSFYMSREVKAQHFPCKDRLIVLQLNKFNGIGVHENFPF